jgi:hypothetical protein
MPCKQENDKLILSFNILIKDGGRKMPANSTKAATTRHYLMTITCSSASSKVWPIPNRYCNTDVIIIIIPLPSRLLFPLHGYTTV